MIKGIIKSSYLKVSTTCLLSLFASHVSAASTAPTTTLPWVVTLSGGAGVSNNVGRMQTFDLTPTIKKSYAPTGNRSSFFSGGLFIAKEKVLNDTITGQFGVELSSSSNAKSSGLIYTEANPQLDNHSYQYKINHSLLAAKGKLISTKKVANLSPWVSGSIGAGFNRAHSFSNTPLPGTGALANNNFSNKTTTTVSYSLSVGVEKAMNANWLLGIGYEFSDWGKSELGRAQGQTLNSGLSMNHLYTHNVLAQLTYKA